MESPLNKRSLGFASTRLVEFARTSLASLAESRIPTGVSGASARMASCQQGKRNRLLFKIRLKCILRHLFSLSIASFTSRSLTGLEQFIDALHILAREFGLLQIAI